MKRWAVLMVIALALGATVSEGKTKKTTPSKPLAAKDASAAEDAPLKPSAASAAPSPLPSPSRTPVPHLSYDKDSPASDKPYWKSKPDLLKRMANDRYITVSVKRDDAPNGHAVFTMAGAGDVNRDKDACFALAQDFPKLKQISDHFKTVTYEEKTQKLFVVTEALGYQARMMMQLTPVVTPERNEIQWEVVWGSFKGMKGVIGFERLGPRSTEISFRGRFEAPELPIPKIIMGFALEVVTQKVAERMRSYLEEHLP